MSSNTNANVAPVCGVPLSMPAHLQQGAVMVHHAVPAQAHPGHPQCVPLHDPRAAAGEGVVAPPKAQGAAPQSQNPLHNSTVYRAVVSRVGKEPRVYLHGRGEVRFAYRNVKKRANDPRPILAVGDVVECQLTSAVPPKAVCLRQVQVVEKDDDEVPADAVDVTKNNGSFPSLHYAHDPYSAQGVRYHRQRAGSLDSDSSPPPVTWYHNTPRSSCCESTGLSDLSDLVSQSA